jgi:predicted dehydrogenase
VCANARVFEDDVASSQATRSPTARSREQAVDDDAIDVLIDFESGALGVIQTSWCAAGRKNDLEFEVYGDKGSLGFSWPHANELLYFSRLDAGGREGSRRLIIGPEHPGAAEFWPVAGLGLGYSDAFLIALGRFVRSVATGGDASPNFLEGLRACEVTDAIRASAEAGAWKHVQREPRTARGA